MFSGTTGATTASAFFAFLVFAALAVGFFLSEVCLEAVDDFAAELVASPEAGVAVEAAPETVSAVEVSEVAGVGASVI